MKSNKLQFELKTVSKKSCQNPEKNEEKMKLWNWWINYLLTYHANALPIELSWLDKEEILYERRQLMMRRDKKYYRPSQSEISLGWKLRRMPISAHYIKICPLKRFKNHDKWKFRIYKRSSLSWPLSVHRLTDFFLKKKKSRRNVVCGLVARGLRLVKSEEIEIVIVDPKKLEHF